MDESKQRKENRFQNQRIKFNKTKLQILLKDVKNQEIIKRFKNNSSKSRFTTNFITSTQVDQSYSPSRFLSFHSPKFQIPVFQPSG